MIFRGEVPTFIETANGKVNFVLDYQVGDLVALLLDEAGEYTLLKMDRSEDHSDELYLDVLKRWIAKVERVGLTIIDVGELIFDDSDPLTCFLNIDDNLLAYVTTYPLPEGDGSSVLLYLRSQPDFNWYLHVAHQCMVNGNQNKDHLTVPLANAYFNARSQRVRG